MDTFKLIDLGSLATETKGNMGHGPDNAQYEPLG
jgi:hypothetical protein